MSDEPSDIRFSTTEELIQYLREHVDDVDSVVIPVQEAVQVQGPNRRPQVWKGVGALLKLCDGRSLALRREDAARLINDGVLQRMKIKCVIDPLKKP